MRIDALDREMKSLRILNDRLQAIIEGEDSGLKFQEAQMAI